MNKKTVFLISLSGTLLGFSVSGLTMLRFWCGASNYSCWDKLTFLGNEILIFTPALVLSVITYKMREEVFRAWLHFAYWWIPLSLVMVYLAAGTSGGGFGIPNVFDQETVAFIFSGLFLIISLLLIAIKSFLLRRRQ